MKKEKKAKALTVGTLKGELKFLSETMQEFFKSNNVTLVSEEQYRLFRKEFSSLMDDLMYVEPELEYQEDTEVGDFTATVEHVVEKMLKGRKTTEKPSENLLKEFKKGLLQELDMMAIQRDAGMKPADENEVYDSLDKAKKTMAKL